MVLFLSSVSFAVSCGDTITANTVLSGDLGACSGDGLVVGADNIVLDCQGYEITGTNNSSGIFLNSRNNVTVKNCIVGNFSIAFRVYKGSDNTLTDNTGRNNLNEGVTLQNTTGNVLTNNVVHGNRRGFYLVFGSTHNNLINNTVYQNEWGFIGCLSNKFNNLIANTIYSNSKDGIYFHSQSSHNSFIDNTVYNNAEYGFRMTSGNNTTLTGNKVHHNKGGIFLYKYPGSTLIGNEIHHNEHFGLNLEEDNYDTILENNTVYNQPLSANSYVRDSSVTLRNGHYYGGSNYDLYVSTAAEEVDRDIVLERVVFDNPAGGHTSETLLSLSDVMTRPVGSPGTLYYRIEWSAAAVSVPTGYTVFDGKKLHIDSGSSVPIDSVTWQWPQEDANGYNETAFELWVFYPGFAGNTGAMLDTDANTLTLTNHKFQPGSTYVILEAPVIDSNDVPDNEDACSDTLGYADRQGCLYANKNFVRLHIIDMPKRGDCNGADSCKLPLEAAEIKVFDRNDADFQALWTKNPPGTFYEEVFGAGIGLVGSCTTDADGYCAAGEEYKGEFLMIVKYFDLESGQTVYTGSPKGPSDFVDGVAVNEFQIIKVIRKDGTIDCKAGRKTVVTGSALEIISPNSVVWEGTQELYPFIFTSDSNWSIDICMGAPRGYGIAGIYDENDNHVETAKCTHAFASGESKVIAFELLEIASPEPKIKARITVEGPTGQTKQLDLDIDGIRQATKKANGRPFRTEQLSPTVLLLMVGGALAVLALFVITRRRRG